jgi:hypothetical protein
LQLRNGVEELQGWARRRAAAVTRRDGDPTTLRTLTGELSVVLE